MTDRPAVGLVVSSKGEPVMALAGPDLEDLDAAVPMLTFCGFDLELFVREVLAGGDWPAVCWASDRGAGSWLIVQTDVDPQHLQWICAPTSDRAIRAFRDRRCSVVDVVCHSVTGTVEVVTVDHGRAVPDRCLLCGQVPDHLGWAGTPLAAA